MSLGITIGLGATPQEKIHLVRPTIDGVKAMIEQPSQDAQPSSTTSTPTTTPTTTATTTATTTTTTTLATMSTAPIAPTMSTTVTPSFVISQMPMLVMTSTTEIVTIYNMDSNSNQEEVEPSIGIHSYR